MQTTKQPVGSCHCGAEAQGPPSQYPDVCTQWPLCEQAQREWEFESGDPDVGIFGDSVVHAACPQVDPDDDVTQATQTDVTVRASRTPGVLDVITTFTCPACGAVTRTKSQEPAEHFEEPR